MGGGQGIEKRLGDILGRGPLGKSYADVGQVDAVSADGRVAEVTLRPSGREIDARLIYYGLGSKGGIFFPVEVGDEVVVVFPDGDANNAVAIAGVGSIRSLIPPTWAKDAILVLHPGGMVAQTTVLAIPGPVANKEFLADLAGILDDIVAIAGGAVVAPNAVAAKIRLLAGDYDTKGIKSD